MRKSKIKLCKGDVIKSVLRAKDFKEAEKIIKWQNEKLGELFRRVEWLEDSERKRQQWLDDAKKEAGYNRMTSFDTVWAETLAKARKTVL